MSIPQPAFDDARSRSSGTEVRAMLLGERVEVRGFEPPNIVSMNPLAFRPLSGGLIVIYRFGAVVFIGADADTERQTIELLGKRIVDVAQSAEPEVAFLVAESPEDNVIGSGRFALIDLSEARLMIVADALAKSVALAGDEREMRKVFEQIEPFAQKLAATGRAALTSKALLQLLGDALVAQARMVGRVEVQEKPELLWDRPDLQRLHARLEDEYELDDRARALARKLKVIEESAATLADVADARRTLRLEIAVVALISVEILLTLFEMSRSLH